MLGTKLAKPRKQKATPLEDVTNKLAEKTGPKKKQTTKAKAKAKAKAKPYRPQYKSGATAQFLYI